MDYNKGPGIAGIILILVILIIFVLVCREKLVWLAGCFYRGLMETR